MWKARCMLYFLLLPCMSQPAVPQLVVTHCQSRMGVNLVGYEYHLVGHLFSQSLRYNDLIVNDETFSLSQYNVTIYLQPGYKE